MPETWSAMLHLLVFAYWLGGDVGAFTASYTLTDKRQPPAARLAAARILNRIDMAPRSALVLALPTGVALASAKGWVTVEPLLMAIVWTASLIWLALVVWLHMRQDANVWLRRLDLSIRLALIVALAAGASMTATAMFQIKFLCLAAAATIGVLIRMAVAPMSQALAQLSRGEGSPAADAQVARALTVARPLVVSIWICLLIAAWAGIAKPI